MSRAVSIRIAVGPLLAPRPAHDVDPLGAGHPPVEDGHVVLVPAELVDRVVAAFDGIHVVAGLLEPHHEELAQAGVVLGDEDAHRVRAGRRVGGPGAPRRPPGGGLHARHIGVAEDARLRLVVTRTSRAAPTARMQVR